MLLPATERLVDGTFDRDARGPLHGVHAGRAAHRAAAFVLEHLQPAAERCFADQPDAPRVVGANFVVESGGHITGARVEGPPTAAAACIERALTAQVFPDPGHYQRHRIHHDFVLTERRASAARAGHPDRPRLHPRRTPAGGPPLSSQEL